jgi:hypothetical protein
MGFVVGCIDPAMVILLVVKLLDPTPALLLTFLPSFRYIPPTMQLAEEPSDHHQGCLWRIPVLQT